MYSCFQSVKRVINISVLSFLFMALIACVPAVSTTKVTTPTEGQKLVKQTLTVAMTYVAASTKPVILLNGRNISKAFSFGTTSASATATPATFAYVLKQGLNTLVVKQTGTPDLVRTFNFDNVGPKVIFTAIDRVGNNLSLTGKVTDGTGIRSVTINNTVVSVNALGDFAVTIAKAATYGVKAEDTNGIKSYDHYLASGTAITPMIRASVDETLIDDISPVVAFALGAPKDTAIFDVINPLVEQNIFGLALKANLLKFQVQADGQGKPLGTATVNSLKVSPTSSSSTVTADITIPKPIIGVEVKVGDFPIKVNVRADKLDIKGAKIRLATNAQQNLVVEFTETLPIDLLNTTIEIVDSGPIIGFLLGNPITNIIVSFVTDSIEGLISGALPTIINAEVANRLQGLFLGINENNNDIVFKTGISSFGKSGTKVLADLTAQYQVKNSSLDEYALGIKTVSSINQTTGAVTVGGALPIPNNFGQLNATVSFNFINQAMLFVYEAGLLDLNLVGNQIVIGEANVNAVATEGALWIQIKPSIPELQLFGGTSVANVNVNLDAFTLNVSIRSGNTWNKLMNLTAGVNLNAAFGFDPATNSLLLQAGNEAPVVNVKNIQTFGIAIPTVLANGVVDLAVPVVADVLMDAFKIKLPLPADLPVQLKNISTVGSKGSDLSVSMNVNLGAIINSLLAPPVAN